MAIWLMRICKDKVPIITATSAIAEVADKYLYTIKLNQQPFPFVRSYTTSV